MIWLNLLTADSLNGKTNTFMLVCSTYLVESRQSVLKDQYFGVKIKILMLIPSDGQEFKLWSCDFGKDT